MWAAPSSSSLGSKRQLFPKQRWRLIVSVAPSSSSFIVPTEMINSLLLIFYVSTGLRMISQYPVKWNRKSKTNTSSISVVFHGGGQESI